MLTNPFLNNGDMTEEINTKRQEQLAEITLLKLAGMEGSKALTEFVKRISNENPDKMYAPNIADELNPDRMTYVARRGDVDLGMWDGIKRGREFDGLILIVDPKYHGQGVGVMLKDVLLGDSDVVRISVYPFGQPRSEDPALLESRKQKLVEYYKTWGFVEDRETPTNGDPVIPMIWRRPETPPEKQL